jgi:hypothetical protein
MLFSQVLDIGNILLITRVGENIEKNGSQVADKGVVLQLGDSVDC